MDSAKSYSIKTSCVITEKALILIQPLKSEIPHHHMQTSFSYDTIEYRLTKNRFWIRFNRITGLLYALVGIAYFTPWGWHQSKMNTVFAILLIVLGGLEAILPNWHYRIWKTPFQYVRLEDGIIKWKDGYFNTKTELLLRDVKEYQVYIGEIHFITFEGQRHKLPIHMIEDQEKQDELVGLLREQFRVVSSE